MPEFVATLLAAAAFCLTLMLLNAATRWLLEAHLGPQILCENSVLQYGSALVAARAAYRRAPQRHAEG
ncbi:hypothetical protein [Methylobacterium persicinum]|uniref:Uncharacterized protein n=1 Tax=Methylobacterium persicinum TaxID=374426 RepID=A0ABU0HER1_9HYPH|nr:hypothetical protein [Methylobacterium persicinum]MDQ0440808.1 hypothetical protein [Methylobacterium persicinum]GJE36705.1 hypothetical protein KHHGKMAE_0756 [Methylobacterium persicinum]